MPFSVDELKGAISRGIAAPNLFRVYLPALPGIIGTRQLNLLCKDVQLPGRQILTSERTVGMKQVKQAYGYAQDDVSLTFHVTNDYAVKEYFEYWQSLIINFDNKDLNYPDEYGFEVRIEQLEKGAALDLPVDINFNLGQLNIDIDIDLFTSAKSVYTCILEKAFPTTMNAIQFNNEANGMVELNVQLSYKDWSSV